jgi:hypothetical protein
VIATLNREITLDRVCLLEALVSTLRGIQFWFEMRVGDEQEREITRAGYVGGSQGRLSKDGNAERR